MELSTCCDCRTITGSTSSPVASLVRSDDPFRRNEVVDEGRGHLAGLDRLERCLLPVNADNQDLVKATCIFDRLNRAKRHLVVVGVDCVDLAGTESLKHVLHKARRRLP